MPDHSPQEALLTKIAKTRYHWKLLHAISGTLWLTALFLLFALLCYHIDRAVALSASARVAWKTLLIAGGALGTVGTCLLSALRKLPDALLAERIEQAFPVLNERLLTVINLFPTLATTQGTLSSGFSALLTRRLLEETHKEADNLDFKRAVSKTPLRNASIAFLLLAGVTFTDRTMAAEAFDNWLNRMAHPYDDIAPWANTRVWLTPNKKLVPSGEGLSLTVTTRGVATESATLYYRNEQDNNWQKVELRNPKAANDKEGGNVFQHHFASLSQTTLLKAVANDGKSNEQKVLVEALPTLLGFQMKLHFPAYMNRAVQTLPIPNDKEKDSLTSDGNIVAPVGTKVEIVATANKPLKQVEYIKDKQTAGEWQTLNERAMGNLEVWKEGTYSLRLTDTHDFHSTPATPYEIRAVQDQTPAIQVAEPTTDMDLVPNGKLPIRAHATDDYGITRLGLHYSRIQEDNSGAKTALTKTAQGDFTLPGANGSPTADTSVAWQLSSVHPKAGETVLLELTATDNDTLSGPHIGRSNLYRIHVVSLPEMQHRLKEQIDEEHRALDQLRQKQIELQQSLQKARSQKDNKELTRTQEEQRNLAQEAKAIAQRVNELTTRLENNNLATESEAKRRDEASKLLDNLAQQKIPASADKIQKAQNTPARSEKRNETLNQAAQTQAENRKEIEKAQQLLQGTPSVEQLAKDLERLAKDQRALADGSRSVAEDIAASQRQTGKKSLTEDQKASLDIERKQQSAISAETKDLQQKLQDMAKSASERGKKEEADALQNAAKALQQGAAAANQDKAQKALNQNQPQNAASAQDKAASALEKASSAAKEAQQAQGNKPLKEALAQIEKTAEELKQMAQQQKDIAQQIAKSPNAQQSAKLAQQEKALQDKAQKASSSLNAVPQAQQNLQQAQQSLKQSSQELSQSQSQKAKSPAEKAAQQLQAAAQQAQQAAEQIKQQQMADALAGKIEEMAQTQKALRSATQRINDARQHKTLTPLELRELGQLASRQRFLEQKANDLADEFPSPNFKKALKTTSKQMTPATRNLNIDQPDTGNETQTAQRRAAQSLDVIAKALRQQSKGGKPEDEPENAQNDQQDKQNGPPTPENAQQYAALGDLMLAQGQQEQIRQETGKLDKARQTNPDKNLNAAQQKQTEQTAGDQQETHDITQSAGQQLQNVKGAQEAIQKATQAMRNSREQLAQKQTGNPTQKTQEQASSQLSQAIQKVQEQLEQQKQQQQAQQQGNQQGTPQPSQKPGDQPEKNPFTRIADVKRGATSFPIQRNGKGFANMNQRDQRTLREGQRERVPAEYQEIVNRYYKSLAEKKR